MSLRQVVRCDHHSVDKKDHGDSAHLHIDRRDIAEETFVITINVKNEYVPLLATGVSSKEV